MTIKLKPDCELERAIDRLVNAAIRADNKENSALEAIDRNIDIINVIMERDAEFTEARAHLLEVIRLKVETGLAIDTPPDASTSVTQALASEIMGCMSDD